MNLYIHIPFCASRCTYCDFNTYAGLDALIPEYMAALRDEIRITGNAWLAQSIGNPVIETIFIGGGTPSLLPIQELELLGEIIDDVFSLSPDLEWSMEANPGTLQPGYLKAIHHLGINRLSLGVQSSHAAELGMLGRIHTFSEAAQAVSSARHAGFANLNLDLIYGLPGQSLLSWQDTLRRCIELEPDHFSLYALSIEENTQIWHRISNGELPAPDDDLAADMYTWAEKTLSLCGYAHYEISNWACQTADENAPHQSPHLACHHNLHVWRNQNYLGFGAGAHGFAGNIRYANILHPHQYIDALRSQSSDFTFPLSPAVQESWPISPQAGMAETMILGLRLLLEGISRTAFEKKHGRSLEDVYGNILSEFAANGLLDVDPEWVRLSERGHLLANQVMQAFLP